MTRVTRTDAVYTWINAGSIGSRYGANPTQLYLQGNGVPADDTLVLIGLGSPIPLGAVVHSAKMYVRNARPRNVSTWMRARALTSNWDAGTVTYKTRPGVSTALLNQTVTKATAALDTLWEFDVTTLMQAVANGAATWFGVQLESNAPNNAMGMIRGRYLNHQPTFIIEFSHPVAVPEDLSPSNGGVVGVSQPTLSASFDYSGSSPISAFEVQLDDADDFVSPIWSSGVVSSVSAELDLSNLPVGVTAPPALAAGVLRYWRIRVQNPDGVWGGWSDVESYQYQPRGTLTLTSPTGTVLGSSTASADWTYSGVQEYYQVLLTNYDTGEVMYDSGKTLDPLPGDTIPGSVFQGDAFDMLMYANSSWYAFESMSRYQVTVRVWDTLANRQNVPGYPIYSEAQSGPLRIAATSTLEADSGLAPASNVSIVTDFPSPEVIFRFEAPLAAKTFSIIRDGVYYESGLLLSAYLDADSGLYEYRTTVPTERHWAGSTNPQEKGWQIWVENETKTSAPNRLYSIKAGTKFAWISNYNSSKPTYRHVALVGRDPVEGALTEKSQIVEPLRSEVPYKVFTVLGKYRGSVSAHLAPEALPEDGRSLAVLKAAITEMRKMAAQGHVMKLTLSDLLIDVTIHNVSLWPVTGPGYGKAYKVTFDWFQV